CITITQRAVVTGSLESLCPRDASLYNSFSGSFQGSARRFMTVDWSGFVSLVRQHQQFLLTTHVRPDGDGLGSQLALADILERMGKKVRVVIASTWPPRYNFMDPDKRIERFRLPGADWQQVQAIIVLDTGTWNQLGDFGTF